MSEACTSYGVSYIASGESDGPWNVLMFRKIINQMFETYKRKNADYGDAYSRGFELFGYNQLLSRIYEKFCRVHHLLTQGGVAQVNESVEDTLADMANQCVCLLILLREQSCPDVDFENVK